MNDDSDKAFPRTATIVRAIHFSRWKIGKDCQENNCKVENKNGIVMKGLKEGMKTSHLGEQIG